jgi:hypothetical protein
MSAVSHPANKDAQILCEAAPAGPPPQVALLQLLTGYWASQAAYAAVRLGVFDRLAENGGTPQSSDTLAAAVGADPASLYRLLRALASVGLVASKPGRRRHFALTPLGAALVSDSPGSMASMALHLVEGPSWRAWAGLLDSVKTGATAFERENGAAWVDYYAAHPESGVPFYRAMGELSQAVADAVTEVYEFCGAHTVVDVGGAHGALLAAILNAEPHARGIVFDLPAVIEGARERIAAAGLTDRCTAEGGDFFRSVPAGDVYVLKHILHDWDDARAADILRTVHHCAAPGARVLVIETVVPEGDAPDMAKWADLHMLVMTGGRERTVSEFQALFQKAGFALTRVLSTPTPVSVVEAVRLA